MYRFYLALVDMLPSTIILIPVYWILNKVYFRCTRKSIIYFLFSCYLCVVYVLVGLPNITYIRIEPNLNLIPFAGIIEDWKNSALNILLFIPLGVMLPIFWDKFTSIIKILQFGFGMSLLIELLQILTFRATDVNDLITNTTGAFCGFLCAKYLLKKHSAIKQMANQTRDHELMIPIFIVLLVMFLIYPFISTAMWDLILL